MTGDHSRTHSFYYIVAGRRLVAKYLPPNSIGCEIGVQRGEFAKILLDSTRITKLHLIDPWKFTEEIAYKTDGANVKQEKQEELYSIVSRRFAPEVARSQVVLHRAKSGECFGSFNDSYFDFVYVDGMHDYQNALADLVNFAPKVKEDGLMMGHDFSENLHSHRMNFGVVGAVNSFLKRGDFAMLAVTNDTWATFVLARFPLRGFAKMFVENLLSSAIEVIALPKNLACTISHQKRDRDDGSTRWIPTFG